MGRDAIQVKDTRAAEVPSSGTHPADPGRLALEGAIERSGQERGITEVELWEALGRKSLETQSCKSLPATLLRRMSMDFCSVFQKDRPCLPGQSRKSRVRKSNRF